MYFHYSPYYSNTISVFSVQRFLIGIDVSKYIKAVAQTPAVVILLYEPRRREEHAAVM